MLDQVMDRLNPFSIAWLVFLVVWLIAALRTKRTQERAPLGTRLAYGIPVLVASYLMFIGNQNFGGPLYSRIIPRSVAIEDIGLFLTVAGIAFAIWARFYIGQNWSGTVTVKVGHELVRSGPYRWVRHPIYSGILLAIIGTALARGKPVGVISIALFWVGFLIKSRKEEEFMRKTFGEQYLEYAQETGALVPKLRF
jgi:protein-S-isoprenylcysteine O-methyltransferase Ste14